jgi:hypothetical protein
MGFSIGGGIGPFRASYRLGGRGGSSGSSESDPIFIALFLAIALVAGGAWAAVEGLGGRWGVTGFIFGIAFILATVIGILINEYTATGFVTSWLYLVLAKLNYFDVLLWPDSWLNTEFETLDEFMLFLLVGLAYLTTLAVVVVLPPAVVYATMRRLHRTILAEPLESDSD